MPDIVSPEVRSRMMAAIGRRDTRPELVVRRALHSAGFRFRVDVKKLDGSPDVVLSKWRTVVFVHGCFWHRHPACRYATTPRTRPDFWRAKFEANRARDHRNETALLEAGWRVAIVWECGLRLSEHREDNIMRLIEFIRLQPFSVEKRELPLIPPSPL